MLGVIVDGGSKCVADVASDLLVSDAKARGAINRLEARGLLARNYTASTTHAFLVFATGNGEAMAAEIFADPSPHPDCDVCDDYGVLDGLEPCPANCRSDVL